MEVENSLSSNLLFNYFDQQMFQGQIKGRGKKIGEKDNQLAVMRLNILFSFYLGGEQAPNENCFMFENIKLNMNHITHFMVLWENWIVWYK